VADFAGTDASGLRSLIGSGVGGVVVQAFGGGRASPGMRRAVAEAAASGLPVVLASRVPEGRVLSSAGSVEDGVLTAGDLPPHRARILLMLALSRGYGPAAIQRVLDTH